MEHDLKLRIVLKSTLYAQGQLCVDDGPVETDTANGLFETWAGV